MRFSVRGVIALLLVLAAAFSGLACSAGTTSKVSKADLDKLNAATKVFNATIAAAGAKAKQDVSRCTGKTSRENCVRKAVAREDASLRSAALTWASVYDQVAGDANGACQTDLKALARTIRADAAKISAGAFPSAERLDKSQQAMISACNLKLTK